MGSPSPRLGGETSSRSHSRSPPKGGKVVVGASTSCVKGNNKPNCCSCCWWGLLVSDPANFLDVYGRYLSFLALRVAAVVCVIAYVLNMEGIFSVPHDDTRQADAMRMINTMHARLQWDAASVASTFKRVPQSSAFYASSSSSVTNYAAPSQQQRSNIRDEYGHLTFAAQCRALEEAGLDPGWPLKRPEDEEEGGGGLGFSTPLELCEAMRTLPERLKVYSFKLPWTARRRYWLTRLAPTFNRGYDVEGHIVESMQAAPFAVSDPAAATAFLIPARPYLERTSSYPGDGREAMRSSVRDIVEFIKREEPDAWSMSEPGCNRVLVTAHDTGTYVASKADPEVAARAVFIASNSDVTSSSKNSTSSVNSSGGDDDEWGDSDGIGGGAGYTMGKQSGGGGGSGGDGDDDDGVVQSQQGDGDGEEEDRNMESVFHADKDVAAVCSLSFHLPKDAVAMGAMTPLGLTTAVENSKKMMTTATERRSSSNSSNINIQSGGLPDLPDLPDNKPPVVDGGTGGVGGGGGRRMGPAGGVTRVQAAGAAEAEVVVGKDSEEENVKYVDPRPITISFRGNTRGYFRTKVFEYYRSKVGRPDWSLESSGQVTPRKYMELMASSKFCLHVRGTRVQSPRLFEVIMFGCVPVIMADGYDLPLSWLLDWSKFSIVLPESEYERLPEVLDAADWATMHDNLRRVISFFVYHRTPILGDAFWATMLGTQRQMARSRACHGHESTITTTTTTTTTTTAASSGEDAVDSVLSDVSSSSRGGKGGEEEGTRMSDADVVVEEGFGNAFARKLSLGTKKNF